MLHNTIRREIEALAVLNVYDAHALADTIVEMTIFALARDPSIPARSFSAWWAMLANTRAHIVDQIHDRIDEYVDVNDVLRTLEFEGVL